MNEEEKEAIERIDYIQDFIIENGQYNADVNDMECFSKILILIEKQQKEIEELNEVLKGKTMRIAFENIDNFISKDKIREIIKDLDEFDTNFYNIDTFKLATKNTLQELLEEK